MSPEPCETCLEQHRLCSIAPLCCWTMRREQSFCLRLKAGNPIYTFGRNRVFHWEGKCAGKLERPEQKRLRAELCVRSSVRGGSRRCLLNGFLQRTVSLCVWNILIWGAVSAVQGPSSISQPHGDVVALVPVFRCANVTGHLVRVLTVGRMESALPLGVCVVCP